MGKKKQSTIEDIKPGTVWLHKVPWHPDFPKIITVLSVSTRNYGNRPENGLLIYIEYVSSETGEHASLLTDPFTEFFPYYYEI